LRDGAALSGEPRHTHGREEMPTIEENRRHRSLGPYAASAAMSSGGFASAGIGDA
jgi:hypothetical protein